MNLSSRHKVDPQFNMSSMTDIVFLLLIFFILTSGVVVTGMEVDLPSGEETKIKSVKVSVTIDSEGVIYIDKDMVSKEQLESKLSSSISIQPEDEVSNMIVIRGDQGCDYGQVIEVYNIAQNIPNATAVLALKPK